MQEGDLQLNPQDFLKKVDKINPNIKPIINPSQEEIDEIIDCLASSFAGDETHQGEKSFHFVAGPQHSDLHSKERMEIFKYMLSCPVYLGLRYGLVYSVSDEITNKLAAAIVVFPPGRVIDGSASTETRDKYVDNIVGKAPYQTDTDTYDSSIDVRYQALYKKLTEGHQLTITEPHYYIGYLGTTIQNQSKGYGRILLELISSMADKDKVPCYLECTGNRNQEIYSRFGYKCILDLVLEYKNNDGETVKHHGMKYMLRDCQQKRQQFN